MNKLHLQVNRQVKESELTERAQAILELGLSLYNVANESQKADYIKQVQDNLNRNDEGLNAIGMGLDTDKVAAGKEFLKRVTN
jgi:hypothetical protein